ncbi:NfeD family protein [Bacteroidota bacterium]
MIWIVLLLLIGIILFFVELFFIPGTTVVGILGVLLTALGIFLAYKDHGMTTGHITLAVTMVSLVIIIVVGAKTNVWGKLSIKDQITGKANLIEENSVKPGDTGETISAIRPIGKALINNVNYEVKSLGEYINSGTAIEVIKVSGNRITVAPLQQEDKKG